MADKKLIYRKSGEKFGLGILIIFLAMAASLFAFVSEGNKITGLAAMSAYSNYAAVPNSLMEFKDVNSLATLSPGNYYIDSDGIVYWLDVESKPAIAKVSVISEMQKNRQVYIDKDGRIGYVLNPIQ